MHVLTHSNHVHSDMNAHTRAHKDIHTHKHAHTHTHANAHTLMQHTYTQEVCEVAWNALAEGGAQVASAAVVIAALERDPSDNVTAAVLDLRREFSTSEPNK
jgi:hypothetical protein